MGARWALRGKQKCSFTKQDQFRKQSVYGEVKVSIVPLENLILLFLLWFLLNYPFSSSIIQMLFKSSTKTQHKHFTVFKCRMVFMWENDDHDDTITTTVMLIFSFCLRNSPTSDFVALTLEFPSLPLGFECPLYSPCTASCMLSFAVKSMFRLTRED